MTDTTLNRYVSSGTAAERAAFTPVPPTPASGPDPGYAWGETDTHQGYMSDGTTAFRLGSGVKGADIASGATITIGNEDYFHVTGTTTITDIDFSQDHTGRDVTLVFDGALTLTHNATSLILPTGANITTAAGDSCVVRSECSDNVRVVSYQRKDGTALAGGSFTAASTTEVLTGTDSTKGVTPDSLAALWEQGSDIASAGTISVGEGGFFHITGTTTITDIDFATTKAGRWAWLVFDGALTLTHNATTLILPTGANITTAAGDSCLVISEGGDNVRIVNYQRKDGTPLVGASGRQDQIYPDFTTPVDGSFSWTNQGGASVTVNANGGIYLLAPANAGESMRIRRMAAPSTPYTITACFLMNLADLDFHRAGLCWRQSSDGKIITVGIGTGNSFPSDLEIAYHKWTNETTFSATAAEFDILANFTPIWFQITDNGTNRIAGWSSDGYNFTTLFTETRTTFLTADQVGFFCMTSTATLQASCTLLSWAQT